VNVKIPDLFLYWRSWRPHDRTEIKSRSLRLPAPFRGFIALEGRHIRVCGVCANILKNRLRYNVGCAVPVLFIGYPNVRVAVRLHSR
jgi:hypothetical protein